MLKSRFAISALAIAAVSIIAACDQQKDVTSPEAAPVAAKQLSASQIDSIALQPDSIVTWAPAPGQCANGFLWTGCPRINYRIYAYSNGVLVAYVESRDWTSSDESVATVNNKGNADVIGAGTTTITVTYDHGRLTASATITAN